MKTTLTTLVIVAGLVTMTMVGCGRGSVSPVMKDVKDVKDVTDVTATSRHGSVERGAYLVKIMGCNDCHTPFKMGPRGPEPDMDRALSGHPESIGPLKPPTLPAEWAWSGAGTNTSFSGPWGVSYTANLTPDQNTGLGIWTEDMFVSAIRTGRHMGTSREIMPPMPWPQYRNATDDDLASVFAYLRTLKPVRNHVPDVQPPAGVATTN